MTDRDDDERQPDIPLSGALRDVLAGPALWVDPDPAVEDTVVAAIAARSEPPGRRSPRPAKQRRWRAAAVAAAATAAAAALVVGIVVSRPDGAPSDPSGTEVVMVGTDRAPAAGAVALVTNTPLGTRIDLRVRGLGPAPDGSYYEAWMWSEDRVAVSAGTFHLRGGNGSIELWSGVGPEEYPRLTVTLQEEGEADSSDETVLVGR